jgi:hypothetical protein
MIAPRTAIGDFVNHDWFACVWAVGKFVVSGAGGSVRCRRSRNKNPAKVTILAGTS